MCVCVRVCVCVSEFRLTDCQPSSSAILSASSAAVCACAHECMCVFVSVRLISCIDVCEFVEGVVSLLSRNIKLVKLIIIQRPRDHRAMMLNEQRGHTQNTPAHTEIKRGIERFVG